MFAWRRSAVHRRVVVNLKTGSTFDGILAAKRGPLLVIKDARSLTAGAAPTPLVGELLVERSNVDFVQVAPVVEG